MKNLVNPPFFANFANDKSGSGAHGCNFCHDKTKPKT